jgi:predicted kinase
MKDKIAIFVCGSGGSGKSTFIRTNLKEFTHIDVDIIYEELLIENGLGLKIKDFDINQTKLANKLFEEAKVLNNSKLKSSILNSENIVIDGIGRDSEIILEQRSMLNQFGYNTFLIMMYSELNVCISRIEGRDRIYKPNLTKDSWYLAYDNIGTYKREFGDNFLFIYNDSLNYMNILNQFINGGVLTKTIL